MSAGANQSDFRELVAAHVRNSRGWEHNSYRIEQQPNEGGKVVFWVLHSDDERSVAPGAGKSFIIYIDPSSKQLTELHFQ